MRRVIIESPYGDPSDLIVQENVEYTRKCVRDSLSRGEAPIASHLLYTQPNVLNDRDPIERQWGIDAGLAWREVAEASVVYTDRGITKGMQYGINKAVEAGIPVEYRSFGREIVVIRDVRGNKVGTGKRTAFPTGKVKDHESRSRHFTMGDRSCKVRQIGTPIMTLIALCGPKGSGKTTLAKLLSRRNSVARTSFADPIREMLRRLLEYQGCPTETIDRMFFGDLKEEPSIFLGGRSYRYAAQTIGTEWRDLMGKNFWTDIWEQRYNTLKPVYETVIVDDLRFLHEAERICSFGGFIFEVIREGYGPGDHQSEKEFLEISNRIKIINNQDPKYMLDQITYILDTEL